MADVQEQTGKGTLYDTDDVELAMVVYRVESQSPDAAEWGGEISFGHDDTIVDAGLCVLGLEDGTQVDLALAVDTEGPQHAVKEIGTFGQRIT